MIVRFCFWSIFVARILSTFGSSARRTDETAFLINERLIPAMRTSLPVSLSPIGQIFLQSSLDPVFPTVDRLTIQFKARNQFQYLRNRHSVPENPRYQLGIIPIFRIEFIGQPLDSSLVATLIGELEVIPLRTIFIHSFHNFSLDYILRTKIPSSSSAKPVKISYGLPSFKPTKAIHFSLLFWKRTTSASNSIGRTNVSAG